MRTPQMCKVAPWCLLLALVPKLASAQATALNEPSTAYGQTARLQFETHWLARDSQFSAATAFDINGDGAKDIVCGGFWYQGPGFVARHRFREVQSIRGRYDDYSNLKLDVDDDGDLDIVSVNYRSKSLYWAENPGAQVVQANPVGTWKKHIIDTPGTSETGRLVDIDGDRRLDILPSGTNFAAWYRNVPPPAGKRKPSWKHYPLPEEMAGHGIGAGDVDGDGRVDLVCPAGWASPGKTLAERWQWHPEFKLARDCGLPIIVADVDHDGDSDLIWSRGHDYGVYWTEQLDSASEQDFFADSGSSISVSLQDELAPLLASSRWRTHAIDTSWSCGHTLLWEDLNSDGAPELIAAKRYQGHDGRDPGENAPLRIVAYTYLPQTATWHSQSLTTEEAGIDLDSVCEDLDGDGDLDIIAPTRAGLAWLENQSGQTSGEMQIAPSANPSLQNEESPTPKCLFQNPLHYRRGDQQHLVDTKFELGRQRGRIQTAMQDLAGTLPKSFDRVPLDLSVQSIEVEAKYWRLHISYNTTHSTRVPAWLLVPRPEGEVSTPKPAALCLHPTHFDLGKSQICGLGGKSSRFYAHELAERGFVCLAPDYPGFGERKEPPPESGFSSGTMQAIWENIRAIDLLETLHCVNRDAIGVVGHSLGGHNGLFTAMFDGRLRAVVSSCGFTAMTHYRGGDLTGWTSQRYLPSVKDVSSPKSLPLDFAEIFTAIAPVPVFVSAPINDDNFAIDGVRLTETLIRPAYKLAGAEGAIQFHYPEADHDFPLEMRLRCYRWLESQLQR
ncbi:MAG TPA: hypothetical protein DDW52_09720 [Planctomycetaceae bacterium]|nr:hypothetical protein [Planctomycetaceae bacterium]